ARGTEQKGCPVAAERSPRATVALTRPWRAVGIPERAHRLPGCGAPTPNAGKGTRTAAVLGRRRGRFGEGQGEDERGAAFGGVLHPQVCAVREQDLARYGQTEAGSLAGRLGGEKPVEDLGLDRGRDAGSVVDETNLRQALEPAGLDGDGGALLGR